MHICYSKQKKNEKWAMTTKGIHSLRKKNISIISIISMTNNDIQTLIACLQQNIYLHE